MHGKNIKVYRHSGQIRDDSDFIRLRDELERLMVQNMRDEGYLPVQDFKTLWATKWLEDKYEFILTMYAAFAGKKKSKQFDFWNNGMLEKTQ